MFAVSPTRYVPASAYAHAGPIAAALLATARRSLRFEVAAAQLRPTVAVLGESGVLDDVTAAARQRQAARRRARLPPHRYASRRHRPNVA